MVTQVLIYMTTYESHFLHKIWYCLCNKVGCDDVCTILRYIIDRKKSEILCNVMNTISIMMNTYFFYEFVAG